MILIMASTPVAASEGDIDATLVIDNSMSMRWDRWEQAVKASTNFVNQMDEDDRAAVYAFGSSPSDYPGRYGPSREKEFTQTTNTGRREINDAIEGMSPDYWTPLYDTIGYAVDYSVEEMRDSSTGALVVMTDGMDNINHEFYPSHDYREKEYVSEAGGDRYGLLNCPQLIYIVGLDIDGLSESSMNLATEDEAEEYIGELKNIAESSGGSYYSAEEAEELDDIYQEIHEEIEEEAREDSGFLSNYWWVLTFIVIGAVIATVVAIAMSGKKTDYQQRQSPAHWQQRRQQQPLTQENRQQQQPGQVPIQESTQQSDGHQKNQCPVCGGHLRYIEQYESWYCDTCQEYK